MYYTPEVFGPSSNGGYAESHLAPEYLVAKKAAPVPPAGGMAHEALVGRLDVKVGETVLIHGGAGGVGSFAIQIAKSAGARMLSAAGPDNQKTLKSLGADVAIDYASQNFVEAALEDTGGAGAEAVLDDDVGGDTEVNSIAATRTFGRLATILGGQGDFMPMYQKNQTLHGVLLHRERARLDALTVLIERGQIRPLVQERLAQDEVGKAHERLDSGHGSGKVVLRVAEK